MKISIKKVKFKVVEAESGFLKNSFVCHLLAIFLITAPGSYGLANENIQWTHDEEIHLDIISRYWSIINWDYVERNVYLKPECKKFKNYLELNKSTFSVKFINEIKETVNETINKCSVAGIKIEKL
jgi:hypothetical protein